MAAPKASGASKSLLSEALELRASTQIFDMLEEVVEEPVEEASKLFEVDWLEATLFDAA